MPCGRMGWILRPILKHFRLTLSICGCRRCVSVVYGETGYGTWTEFNPVTAASAIVFRAPVRHAEVCYRLSSLSRLGSFSVLHHHQSLGPLVNRRAGAVGGAQVDDLRAVLAADLDGIRAAVGMLYRLTGL